VAVLDPIAGVIHKTVSASPVAALVGSRVSIFGDHKSSAAAGVPYIIVEQIAGDDTNHLGGHSSVAFASVQVSCVGLSYASAQSVRQAALTAWRGAYPQTITRSADSVRILSAQVVNQNDRKIGPTDGSSSPRYMNTFDLELRYETA
jgi:hypothetical protein